MYLASDPGNGLMFDCKGITTSEVMNTANKYSTFFDDKTIFAFGQWCGRKKLEFLNASSKRGNKDDKRITTRSIYVLKDKYLGKFHQIFIPHL